MVTFWERAWMLFTLPKCSAVRISSSLAKSFTQTSPSESVISLSYVRYASKVTELKERAGETSKDSSYNLSTWG